MLPLTAGGPDLKKGTRSPEFETRNVYDFSGGAYRFGFSWNLKFENLKLEVVVSIESLRFCWNQELLVHTTSTTARSSETRFSATITPTLPDVHWQLSSSKNEPSLRMRGPTNKAMSYYIVHSWALELPRRVQNGGWR